MKSTKRIIALVVVAAVVVLGGWRIRQAYVKKQAPAPGRPGAAGPAAARIVNVSVGKARTGAVREEILLTGALKPKEQVDVMPKATGRVEQLLVQVGDFVQKGQLIAKLEDDELQQQVKRAMAQQTVARASSAQRKAELANAKAEMERARILLSEQLVPQQEFAARQTAFEVVQAQLTLARAQEEQAQAELNELQIRLEQSKIHAPMNGFVGKRYVDVGALVQPSTPLINLVNLSIMVTMANVPEREIGRLRVGHGSTVTVDAFSDRTFNGRVARISPVLDAATRSATVEIEIPNPGALLKSEMFARVMLDLASTRQAVLIPREALVYRGQQPGVYVLQANQPVFRTIETGLTQGEDVEVLGQLTPGTTIITRGATMLTDGAQIAIAGERGGRGGRGEAAGRGSAPNADRGGRQNGDSAETQSASSAAGGAGGNSGGQPPPQQSSPQTH